MNKKQLVNQLNSEKGITGGDVVIAILIILTTIGVIGTAYANLVIGSRQIDRKTGATRIATNILENMSTLYYDEIELNLKKKSDSGEITKKYNTYSIPENIKVFNTNIPKGYNVEIIFNGVKDTTYDGIKKVTVNVKYKVDENEKNVSLTKVFERENIRECNSPNFAEEYIKPIAGSNFEIYNMNSSSVQICPIQYDNDSKKYKIVDYINEIWYSYSNKQWARILVLQANELNTYIDTTTKTVKDVSVLKSVKSYVWIPRFGVKNGGNNFGYTLFKFKNTNSAIKNSYFNDTSSIYYTLDNSIQWATRGISFEGDNTSVGVWSKYSDISKPNTDAYNLNHSQYGPMMEY